MIALDIETIQSKSILAKAHVEQEKTLALQSALTKHKAACEKIQTQYKQEATIAKHLAEQQEKYKEQVATIPDAVERRMIGNRKYTEIVCIGLAFIDCEGHLVHETFTGKENVIINNFIDWMDKCATPNPRMVTFNGDGFDFPQLIAAFSRWHTNLVFPINPRDCIDLMRYPFERNLGSITLDELADVYNIGEPQGPLYQVKDFNDLALDGSYVAAMHEADQLDGGCRVAHYCNRDTYKTLYIARKVAAVFKL